MLIRITFFVCRLPSEIIVTIDRQFFIFIILTYDCYFCFYVQSTWFNLNLFFSYIYLNVWCNIFKMLYSRFCSISSCQLNLLNSMCKLNFNVLKIYFDTCDDWSAGIPLLWRNKYTSVPSLSLQLLFLPSNFFINFLTLNFLNFFLEKLCNYILLLVLT